MSGFCLDQLSSLDGDLERARYTWFRLGLSFTFFRTQGCITWSLCFSSIQFLAVEPSNCISFDVSVFSMRRIPYFKLNH